MNHDIVFAPGITMRSLVHGRAPAREPLDEHADEEYAEPAQENADAE